MKKIVACSCNMLCDFCVIYNLVSQYYVKILITLLFECKANINTYFLF